MDLILYTFIYVNENSFIAFILFTLITPINIFEQISCVHFLKSYLNRTVKRQAINIYLKYITPVTLLLENVMLQYHN